MIRTLKFLGVAAIAALAMSSMMASIASADDLTAESYPTTLTGNDDEVDTIFSVDNGPIKCTTSDYDATITGPTTTITVTPTVSGCTFAGLAASVNFNGCHYLLHINGGGLTTGTVDIVCSGKEITVTAPTVGTAKCVVHVPAQTGLGTGTGTNIGTETTRELTLHLAITGIKYSQTAGTAETGNCATADNTVNGTLAGKARITGEVDGGTTHVGIFLS